MAFFLSLLFPLLGYSSPRMAENNIAFAYTNVENFVNLCLLDSKCQLSTDQSVLLKKIANSLKREKRNARQLQFSSEKERPGFFTLDGELKVAKTFDDVGSEIYFNKDLIPNLTVIDAIAILVHEFGHHHGINDEEALDLLGLRVAFYYQQFYYQIVTNEAASSLNAEVFNYWNKKSNHSVFKTASHFDLLLWDDRVRERHTAQLLSFSCDEAKPNSTLCDTTPELRASNVHNIDWSTRTTLTGQVTYICHCSYNSLSSLFSVKGTFALDIELSGSRYKTGSAKIRISP